MWHEDARERDKEANRDMEHCRPHDLSKLFIHSVVRLRVEMECRSET